MEKSQGNEKHLFSSLLQQAGGLLGAEPMEPARTLPRCPGEADNCTPGKTRLRACVFAQLPRADGMNADRRRPACRGRGRPLPHPVPEINQCLTYIDLLPIASSRPAPAANPTKNQG